MTLTEPTFAIILLNWNGKQDTLACLRSLEKLCTRPVETIVVDNGSTDDSVAAIRAEFPYITVLETGENLGFAGGNNIGVEYALKKQVNYLFLLNNDTVVDPGILTAFEAGMREHPEAGILGAKIYLYDQRDQFDHFGGRWNPEKGAFDLIGNRQFDDGNSWEEMQCVDYVCGAALCIRKEVIEEIGLLDSRFFLIWEESDFCFRARRAGFATMTCPQAKVWHKVSASFQSKAHSTYFWWRNRLLWIEKNCSAKERRSLYFKLLIPEILHLYKMRLLKTVQLIFKKSPEREERLLKIRAALRGIEHYLIRRFGNGPAWIYKKPYSQTQKSVIAQIKPK